MDDIHHLDTRIRKYRADAQYARQLAETERGKADQYRNDPDGGKMRYHENEAVKQDAKAIELEEEMYQAEDEKRQLEERINALQGEIDDLRRDTQHDNQNRIKGLQKELDRMRGTSLTF